MADFLNQDNIDSLINNYNEDEEILDEILNKKNHDIFAYKLYDFKKPNLINSETLKNLQKLHEEIAKEYKLNISQVLKKPFEVKVNSIEQYSFNEYKLSIPQKSSMVVCMTKKKTPLIFSFDLNFLHYMIKSLQGSIINTNEDRFSLSDIEKEIFLYFSNNLTKSLNNSWSSLKETRFLPYDIITETKGMHFLNGHDNVLIINFEFQDENYTSEVSLCYPLSSFEDLFRMLDDKFKTKQKKQGKKEDIKVLLNGSKINLDFILAKNKITLLDLVNLELGDVIEFNKEIKNKKIGIVEIKNKEKFDFISSENGILKNATIVNKKDNIKIDFIKEIEEIYNTENKKE